MFEKNTVKATEQVKKERYVEYYQQDGKVKVLFIGNSITRHEPKPEIGWDFACTVGGKIAGHGAVF